MCKKIWLIAGVMTILALVQPISVLGASHKNMSKAISANSNIIKGAKVVSAGGGNGNVLHPEYAIDGNPKTAFSFELPNAGAWIVLDLGDAYVLDSIRVTNGQTNQVIWLNEVSVSPDNEHYRPLLGRSINLPMWRGGDTEVVALNGAVARYVKVAFKAGGAQGDISEVAFEGHKNCPERHLMCWSGDLQRDYLNKLDYIADTFGATDVWLDYLETAFPQSNSNSGFQIWEETGALNALKSRGIRYWLSEHEAFTTMVQTPEDLRNDQMWETTLRQMQEIYTKAKKLGFSGLVFDAEDYWSVPEAMKQKYKDFADAVTPWSFPEEFGYNGYYYQRGLQVGKVIKRTIGGPLMQVYEARMYVGKPNCRDGNYWWLKGIHDAGVEIWIATEKTYGAGNMEISHGEELRHLHEWFVRLPQFMIDAHKAFPFATRILPGFHPWNTRTGEPCYLPIYFEEQLKDAQDCAQSYWIYTEGTTKAGDPRDVLNLEFCKKYGVNPEQYLDVLSRYPTFRTKVKSK